MEYYGSNESKDDDESDKKSDGSAKPSTVKAQSIAELLIRKDEASDKHETFWTRDEKSKDEPEAKPEAPETAKATSGEAEESVADSAEAEDAQLAELTPDEAHAIAEQYAAGRRAELRDEEASLPAESPEAAAAVAANVSLIEKLAETLKADDAADPEQATNDAYEATASEQGLDPEAGALPPEATQETTANTEEDADETPAPATAAGAGGSGTPPNVPPNTPNTPGSPNTPNGGNQPPRQPIRTPYAGGYNPNIVPPPSTPNTAPNPNTIPIAEAVYYARQAENRGLLLGGVVGYLIGRRRGRIKTEKRLLPVQRNLEKQVTKLHDTIAGREQQIRTLAAEKARANVQAEQTQTENLRPVKNNDNRAKVPKPELQLSAQPELLVAGAAIPLLEQSQKTEVQPSNREAVTAELLPPKPAEAVQHMNQQELLSAAETVIVEGASLRQAYESHAITERGLRTVMTEYLRGGDVKRALDQELALKELTYERDPQMRDRMAASLAATAVSGGNSATALNTDQANPPVAPNTNDNPTQPTPKPADKSTQTKPLQDTLVRTWIVAVVFLVIVAVILLFR
jgi:hypothetical protein